VPTTPEKVALALVAGLQKDAPEILVGWQSHLAVWCHRIAPWLLDFVLRMATPELRDKARGRKLREA
jgi:3-oxoacyl-[acyl-carrier protein] reductase